MRFRVSKCEGHIPEIVRSTLSSLLARGTMDSIFNFRLRALYVTPKVFFARLVLVLAWMFCPRLSRDELKREHIPDGTASGDFIVVAKDNMMSFGCTDKQNVKQSWSYYLVSNSFAFTLSTSGACARRVRLQLER